MKATKMLGLFLPLTSLLWLGSVEAQQRTSVVRNETVNGYVTTPSESVGGSIREVIDKKYQKRYQEWKDEFLSTDIGRAQWEMYAHHPRLVLTITISGKNPNGAGSGKYKWNEAGELVAAAITLVYYPVMNALEPFESRKLIGGSVLAAAKIAHEFGHIMKISGTPQELYSLQVQLVPMYNKIFLSNGHNVQDPRLVELAQKMGGNPVELWEDREYWGEANAMLFLRDRVAKEKFHCRLFGKIKQAVEEYAKNYEERFAEIAKEQGAIYTCGWR